MLVTCMRAPNVPLSNGLKTIEGQQWERRESSVCLMFKGKYSDGHEGCGRRNKLSGSVNSVTCGCFEVLSGDN